MYRKYKSLHSICTFIHLNYIILFTLRNLYCKVKSQVCARYNKNNLLPKLHFSSDVISKHMRMSKIVN